MRFIGDRDTLTPHLRAIMQDTKSKLPATKNEFGDCHQLRRSVGHRQCLPPNSKQVEEGALPMPLPKDDFARHLSLSDLPAVDMLIVPGAIPYF